MRGELELEHPGVVLGDHGHSSPGRSPKPCAQPVGQPPDPPIELSPTDCQGPRSTQVSAWRAGLTHAVIGDPIADQAMVNPPPVSLMKTLLRHRGHEPRPVSS